MRRQLLPANARASDNTLACLALTLAGISVIGLGLLGWMASHPETLPPPDSAAGRSLLRSYLRISHQIWFVLLALAVGNLIRCISNSEPEQATQEPKRSTLASVSRFISNNPLTTLLFAAYTIAMVVGTTYLYADMIGWYPDLIEGHFLNNFSIRESLIKETMRRTDFRFIPLAHQDIHLLSWFSVHIRTWMLFNAAELIGIVLLSTRLISNLCKHKEAKQSTLLLVATLFLIHSATGTAFFHVIFSERLLCLVMILHFNAYLDHQNNQRRKDLYLALLWGLLGLFIKDTAVILFTVPAITILAGTTIKVLRSHQPADARQLTKALKAHTIERWLCMLGLAFCASYITLSLLPSSYANEGAYNQNATGGFSPDLTFCIFVLIALARALAIASKRIRFNLLDSINIAAVIYAAALASAYQFDSASYLALPVHLIAIINIGWAWMTLVETRAPQRLSKALTLAGSLATATLLISVDHATAKQPFLRTIQDIKFEQDYIQATFNKLYEIGKEGRQKGAPINIIISQQSRFSARRHLHRIPYQTLIEYEPETQSLVVKDGGRKGSTYTLKEGDIIANLDKTIDLIEPILGSVDVDVLYRHNASDRTGIILRVTAVKPGVN